MDLRLTENFYDPVLGTHFCPSCATPVASQTETLEGHLAAVWTHKVNTKFCAILATDELGKTIEDKEKYPSRTLLVQVPSHTSLHYCFECHPFKNQDGCGACGEPVDPTGNHSKVETLRCHTNGYNGDRAIYYFHIDCLPSDFAEIQRTAQERTAKL